MTGTPGMVSDQTGTAGQFTDDENNFLPGLALSGRDIPLLEMVRCPVFILRDERIIWANGALCACFEATTEEFMGALLCDLLEERCREQIRCWFTRPRRKAGEQLIIDIHMAPVERRRRWFNAALTTITWNGDSAVVAFLQDIEDKKKNRTVEQQLRQSQKMESLGRLAGGVAHDMNNTLGAIMGFASVLQAEVHPGSPAADDLDQIMKACRKGRTLMLNLLGFARKGKFRRETFCVNTVIEDVLNLLKHSIPKKIAIVTRLTDAPLEIHGDPTQIHHAVMNLCLNAVDSMGDSGVLTVEVTTERVYESYDESTDLRELEKGEYAVIAVSDTGRGMEPEVAAMAFEPFFTTKPMGEASGLGLPMVYGTVKNHGGDGLLESRVNRGTTVTMMLPLADTNTRSDSSGGNERKTPSIARIATVMLVDDEEMIRLAGRRVLEKMGYGVLLARDGREALRLYGEHPDQISVVILDLIMPVMDGPETFVRLREIAPDLPILLSSGYSKEEKADQLLSLGADAFIQKPFDMQALRDILKGLVETEPTL